MNLSTYDLADTMETVFKMLQQSPFITVLIVEPLLFILAIHFTLYGFRVQPNWRPAWSMKFLNQSTTSLLSAINGVFLGIWGIGCGTVVAKGQDIDAAIMFVFIPFGCASYISRLILRKRGYYSVWEYLAGD